MVKNGYFVRFSFPIFKDAFFFVLQPFAKNDKYYSSMNNY